MNKFFGLLSFVFLFYVFSPQTAHALTIVEMLQGSQDTANFTAKSYVVTDSQTGQVLLSKNAGQVWVPASITKLVTALVVLDAKINLKKVVAMTAEDQVIGGCSSGGACISTKPGVKYKLQDLLYAALVASANNAANAVSRSAGLSQNDFVIKMNAKVKELGALNTVFVEPTGMSPNNKTTAEDYVKIITAAFNDPVLKNILKTQKYSFRSTNNSRYSHSIKSTNKLLADPDITMLGGKTGYLDESQYNFVSIAKDKMNNQFSVVVFGSKNGTTQFAETKELINLASAMKSFDINFPAVLGASTTVLINK